MNLDRDKGLAALRRGDYDEALPLLERACATGPNDFYSHMVLGGIYYELKRDDESVKMLLKAVQLNPDNSQARYNLGLALERIGRKKEAEQAVQSALQLQPDYQQAERVLRRWKRRAAAEAGLPAEDTSVEFEEEHPDSDAGGQQMPAASALIQLPEPTHKRRTARRPAKKEEQAGHYDHYHFEPIVCREAREALTFGLLSLIPLLVGLVLGPLAIARAVKARKWIHASPYLAGSRTAALAIFLGSLGTCISLLEVWKWLMPTLLSTH